MQGPGDALDSLQLGITKRYGNKVVLDNLQLDISKGEFVTFLGPSGCGKSTALSIVAGLIPATEGEIRLNGARIDGLRPDEICRRGVARTFQIVRPFPALTVEDNIMVGALLRTADTVRAAETTRDVMRRLDLFDKRARVAKSASSVQERTSE